MIAVSDDIDKLQNLEKENESLKQKNLELEKYIDDIKNATAEFKSLKEEAAINDVANKAFSKIGKWIGFGVAISFTALFGLYITVSKIAVDTANKTVAEEFKKTETINNIQKILLDKEKHGFTKDLVVEVTKSLEKDKGFVNSITMSLPNILSTKKEFLETLSSELIKLPDFNNRTRAATETAILQAINQINKEVNSELSNSLQETIDSKRYFVLVDSSEDENELRDPNLIKKSVSGNPNNRATFLCKPKGSNKRSVLLVTKKIPASRKLGLESAKYIQNELLAMTEFKTAYILPTDLDDKKTQADNNIFFSASNCEKVSSN